MIVTVAISFTPAALRRLRPRFDRVLIEDVWRIRRTSPTTSAGEWVSMHSYRFRWLVLGIEARRA